jgi:hypothetical protein
VKRGFTLSLFCNRFFLSGSLPYMRNRRCSSGDMACGDMMSREVWIAADGDLTLMSTLLFWWGFMMGGLCRKGCFRPLLLLAIDRRRCVSSPERIEVVVLSARKLDSQGREVRLVWCRSKRCKSITQGRALFTRVDVVA